LEKGAQFAPTNEIFLSPFFIIFQKKVEQIFTNNGLKGSKVL